MNNTAIYNAYESRIRHLRRLLRVALANKASTWDIVQAMHDLEAAHPILHEAMQIDEYMTTGY